MNKIIRTYFYMIVGAISGLIGWQASNLIGLSTTKNVYLSEIPVGAIIGLTFGILLGACIGIFTSLIVVLLARAWLEVKSGKLKGTEFILDKFIKARGPSIFIGSDALKSEIVLPDPDIAPQHAMLTGDGRAFEIKDMSMNGTFINNKRIERAGLNDRQTIKMGNTELAYHEKR